MAEVKACTADRPMRELESIIEGARTTADRTSGIANRLRDMRRRLLGMDEAQTDDPSLKEAVSSELHDLRDTLARTDLYLDEIDQYVSNLESI